MILPTKHIPQHDALLGVGATILRHIKAPVTPSSLWEGVREETNVGTYERFVLAMNLLYLIGAIELQDGLIARASA